MKALDEAEVPIRVVRRGDHFDWGGADWRILHPRSRDFIGASSGAAANASIVYLLGVNGVDALFTGDIERRVAENVATILDPALDEPIDIFLATHHGSKEGSIEELIEVTRPRWAVLSTGRNGYEHPSLEAIERLKAEGASIWCTAVNGSVTARISAAGQLTWRASRQRAPGGQRSRRRRPEAASAAEGRMGARRDPAAPPGLRHLLRTRTSTFSVSAPASCEREPIHQPAIAAARVSAIPSASAQPPHETASATCSAVPSAASAVGVS